MEGNDHSFNFNDYEEERIDNDGDEEEEEEEEEEHDNDEASSLCDTGPPRPPPPICVDNDDFLSRNRGVSSRHDTCIVYALDEPLTRGTYRVFARWLQCHLIQHNLPGCLIVVGFSDRRRRGVANCGDGAAAKSPKDVTINLGCEGGPIPYVRVNANDPYAIFDLKREIAWPSVVLLIALPASRMIRLSCEARIAVRPARTIRQNMIDTKETLRVLVRKYFGDLYNDMCARAIADYDDDNDAIATTLPSATASSRVIGFEQRRENDVVNLDDDDDDVTDDDGATSTANNVVVTDYERYNTPTAVTSTEMYTSQSASSSRWQPAPPLIECADERWEDRFHERTHVFIANRREDVPIIRNDGYDATPNRYYDGRNNSNAVSRLYMHNRALLKDLKRMDVRLTNTHPVDLLPVVHGESVDASLPFRDY